VIGAGETKLVGLGVAVDLDKLKDSGNFQMVSEYYFDLKYWRHFLNSHYLQLMLRSSLGKKGLILPNGVGIIDLDYKDEIKMIIHNPIQGNVIIFPDTEIIYPGMYNIKKGDKIAQITLLEHKAQMFGIETENERSGGFGSTGAGRNEG
jgi:dUTPase